MVWLGATVVNVVIVFTWETVVIIFILNSKYLYIPHSTAWNYVYIVFSKATAVLCLFSLYMTTECHM